MDVYVMPPYLTDDKTVDEQKQSNRMSIHHENEAIEQ